MVQFPNQGSQESMSTEGAVSPIRSNMPGFGSERRYGGGQWQSYGNERQFGEVGELEKLGTGAGQERKSMWGSVRAMGKRRSMITVHEVRWEDHVSHDYVSHDY